MAIGISFMGFDGTKRAMTASSLTDAKMFMSQNEDEDEDDENLTPEERKKRRKAARDSFVAMMRKAAQRRKKQKQKEETEKRKKEMTDLKKKVEKLETDAEEKKGEEENDPVGGPSVGGVNSSSTEPDEQSRAVGSKGGFTIPVSRTEVMYSDDNGTIRTFLVKLEFDLIVSEKGYLKGRSKERTVWTKEIQSGGGNGKYGALADWDEDGVLKSIAFGTEADLDAYSKQSGDGEESGDGEGSGNADNVKVVEVEACTNGLKSNA